MSKTGTDHDESTTVKEEKKLSKCYKIIAYIFCFCIIVGPTFGGALKIFLDHAMAETLPQTTTVTGEGEVSISHFIDGLDTIVCNSYEVQSLVPRDVYLTSGRAKVNREQTQKVTRTAQQLYPPMTLNSFYLLEGSNIHLNVCRVNTNGSVVVDLLVFKGDDSWNKWMKNDCANCNKKNLSLPLNASCDGGRHVLLTYEVTDRDTYYVTMAGRVAGPNTQDLDLRAELNLAQTTFDVKETQKICSQSSTCKVPFGLGSDVDIVLGINQPLLNVQSIMTTCKLRLSFVLGIFLGLPASLFLVGIVLVIASHFSQKRKEREEKERDIGRERVGVRDNYGLLYNEVPPASDSLNSF